MYRNSLKELQVDYIDYMLLHAIGMGGMEALKGRYLDNGILDFLIAERKAGRIRNLGFSYHGDIEVFDYLLSRHEEIKWDERSGISASIEPFLPGNFCLPGLV